MEWLNSVWNLLTTENEFVTKIILSFTIFIEAWIVFKLFTTILKLSYTSKQECLYIIIFSFSALVFEFFIPSPFNTFINYIVMFIIIKSLFKTNTIQTLLSIIIPTIAFALLGILVLKILLLVFQLSTVQAQNTPIYALIYLVVLYTLIFVLTKLFNVATNYNIHFYKNFDTHNKKVILSNLLLGFFTLCTQLTITAFYTYLLPLCLTFLNVVSLFAYFLISFYSLNKTMKLQITTQNLKTAENYNNTLSILYDNVKAFKHDFDNMIFTIGGFINTNDIDGLKKYYISLEKDCEKVNNFAILNPMIINNPRNL